jgi:acyl carrier protein
MRIEDIIAKNPDIIKITPSVLHEGVAKLFNIGLDIDKTWSDNGLDELDVVELIMYIENKLDIQLNDDLCDYLFLGNIKPIIFNDMLSEVRSGKISKLGL